MKSLNLLLLASQLILVSCGNKLEPEAAEKNSLELVHKTRQTEALEVPNVPVPYSLSMFYWTDSGDYDTNVRQKYEVSEGSKVYDALFQEIVEAGTASGLNMQESYNTCLFLKSCKDTLQVAGGLQQLQCQKLSELGKFLVENDCQNTLGEAQALECQDLRTAATYISLNDCQAKAAQFQADCGGVDPADMTQECQELAADVQSCQPHFATAQRLQANGPRCQELAPAVGICLPKFQEYQPLAGNKDQCVALKSQYDAAPACHRPVNFLAAGPIAKLGMGGFLAFAGEQCTKLVPTFDPATRMPTNRVAQAGMRVALAICNGQTSCPELDFTTNPSASYFKVNQDATTGEQTVIIRLVFGNPNVEVYTTEVDYDLATKQEKPGNGLIKNARYDENTKELFFDIDHADGTMEVKAEKSPFLGSHRYSGTFELKNAQGEITKYGNFRFDFLLDY